ncbi:MAG: carboxypeptidase-like regulatory domain-containing protein [Sphingobacteriales bacterium]|nr:MAG: carboxypeptidase-like regulatory domain-containing protein [Sphingobacteriales bacterium]
MKKCCALALLLLCVYIQAIACTLKGKVTDEKGEGLPFATIYVQGTAIGTTANADANYQLALQPGTYKVVCQFMGFKQVTFNTTITGNEQVTHNFSLPEQTLELKDVVVHANAEDPAYAIIRKAIQRREFHLEQVKSFQTSIYLKGVFRNRIMPKSVAGVMKKKEGEEVKNMFGLDSSGRGILYLCEQEADYYSQAPDKRHTIIRSVKQSGTPGGLGLSKLPPVITFYENNVNPFSGAAPRGLISPISDNALNFYKYKYLGEFQENGYTIDKIRVTPKRLYEPLFTGVIYIAEGDWVIHSLKLTATKTANLQTLDTIKIEQVHLPLKKDTWVIKNQLLYPTLNVLGFDVSGYFMTVYNNQKINEPIPDSIFNTKIVSEYDVTATKQDSNYWDKNRPVPLEADEQKDYVVKDSLQVKYSDPHYIDSMRKEFNTVGVGAILISGINLDGKGYKNNYRSNALLSPTNPLVSFNTVEGLVVAPKLYWMHEIDTYRHVYTTVAARYGFSSERFNAIGKVSYRKDNKQLHGKWWEAGVQGGRYVFQFNPNSSMYPLYNTFSTLVYGKNYMKLYERWDAAIFFEKDHGNGLKWNVKLNYQERMPLYNTTGYSWAGDAETKLAGNIPNVSTTLPWIAHNAVIAKASVSYQPGHTYTKYPNYKEVNPSKWPVFTVGYEKGIPDILDSKTDFDKWRFNITDGVRLKLLGELNYSLTAAGFLNDNAVAIPDLTHFSDNQITLAAQYMQSFQLMPYYKYSNHENIYGEAHVEYAMKGLLTNKIPLLRQAQWYFVLGNNTFYASKNNYYTEVFAGIDNLGYKWLRFLRLDVVQSWNSFNQPAIGMRIGIKPGGLVRIRLNNDNAGEW